MLESGYFQEMTARSSDSMPIRKVSSLLPAVAVRRRVVRLKTSRVIPIQHDGRQPESRLEPPISRKRTLPRKARRAPLYPRPTAPRYWRPVSDGQARRTLPPRLRDLWIAILSSRELPCRLVTRGKRAWIYVPSFLEKLASAELAAVAAESTRVQPSIPEIPARHNAHWVLVGMVLLLLWHGMRMQWWSAGWLMPGAGWNLANPEVWLDHGALDVFAVRAKGEWYRCLTALTLHADSEHLFGNMLFGTPFLILLCRRVGIGLGLFLTVLAGALGNAGVALYRPLGFVSMGFSTALFGAVGVLSALFAASPASAGEKMPFSWRRAAVLLAAGVGVLAMLGAEGGRTDYSAHLFGLGAGFVVGGLAGLTIHHSRSIGIQRGIEWLAGMCGAALVIASWGLA